MNNRRAIRGSLSDPAYPRVPVALRLCFRNLHYYRLPWAGRLEERVLERQNPRSRIFPSKLPPSSCVALASLSGATPAR